MGGMKKTVVVAVVIGVLLGVDSSSLFAIEKRDKESTPIPPKSEVTEKKDTRKLPAKGIKKGGDSSRRGRDQVKKFDDFVDKNNNGIDDRIEEKKKP